MKHQQSDIQFLVTVFSLFIMSVALLHITKGSKAADVKQHAIENQNQEVTLSTQDILDAIQPYIASHSIITLAKFLTQFSIQQLIDVVTNLIRTDAPLSSQEKIQLILTLASSYSDNISTQTALFDLLVQMRNYFEQIPILLIAAQSENPAIIDALKTWAQQHNSQFINEQLLTEWTDQALDHAIVTNDLAGLEILYSHGIRPTVKKASALLSQVAQENRDPALVPFLERSGADVNIIANNRTPLMYAVENRNKAMAQALLQAGADPNIIADPSVGSALQLAFEDQEAEIDALLRTYGAK
jgi:hypothetical protein